MGHPHAQIRSHQRHRCGQTTFSLSVVKDLCLTESLEGSEVTFMDIGRDRLNAVTAMSVRYADELGADLVADGVVVEASTAMGLASWSGNGRGFLLNDGGGFDVER